MIPMKLLFFCCFLALLNPCFWLGPECDRYCHFCRPGLERLNRGPEHNFRQGDDNVIFWSTWCDCKEKLPEINEMVKKYSDNDLKFIGINIGMKDTEKKARAYIKEKKMTCPNVFDKTGKLSEKYQLNKVFTLIIAAKDPQL